MRSDKEALEMISCYKSGILNKYELEDLVTQIVEKYGKLSDPTNKLYQKMIGDE